MTKKQKSFLITSILLTTLIAIVLFTLFIFAHPKLYFTKASGLANLSFKKTTKKHKLRLVVPETIDTTKTQFISIQENWFTTSAFGKITAVKAKPGKYLAFDFTDREHDSEVFTIYTQNLFGIKQEYDVIVDYSNFLRVFFSEARDGEIPRSPIILPYYKLVSEYKHIYEELLKIEHYKRFNHQGHEDSFTFGKETVFNKDKANGHAFIVNNDNHITLIYDFLLPGIFANQHQKTQVFDYIAKSNTQFKAFDPKDKNLDIQFKTPPFYLTEFLGWYYIDPTGKQVNLKPGENVDIPKFVKSELRLIARYNSTLDPDKIGDELNKQGLVAVSYFNGAERVFFDVVRKGDPIKNHLFQKSGYAYAGWYKDSALTEKFDFATERANKNISLYLKLVKVNDPQTPKPQKYHTVQFITPKDANQLLPLSHPHGEKLDKNYLIPSLVTRFDKDGNFYELDYWNVVNPITGKETKFDFDKPITEDLILKAVLKKKPLVVENTKYIIKKLYESVDQAGEFIEDKTQEETVLGQKPNEDVTLSADKTKAPYGFTLSPDTILTKTIKPDGTTVFELKYVRNKYKVNFEVNFNSTQFPGANPSTESNQTVRYEGKVQKPSANPTLTKPGFQYVFKHWQLKDEMNGQYRETKPFDFKNSKVTRNLTLVAYFEQKTVTAIYTINHVFEGIEGQPDRTISENSHTAQAGTKITVNRNSRLAGYDRGFIVAQQDQTKTIEADGSTVFTLRYIRRRFSVNYEVNFNSNYFDNAQSSYVPSQNVEFEGYAKKPAQAPTLTTLGYRFVFKHWQLKSEMNGEYKETSPFDFANTKITESITLVAYFEKEIIKAPYTINHILPGVDGSAAETISDASNSAQVGTEVTVDENNRLTKYDEGFLLSPQSQTKTILADGSTTFVLKYTRRKYTVNFEVNYNGNHFNGVQTSVQPDQTILFEGKVHKPDFAPTLTKPGYTYTFKHWQLKDEMGNVYKEVNEFDFNTKITKNTTLVAYFEEKIATANYTINHVFEGITQGQTHVEKIVKSAQVGSSVTVGQNDRLTQFDEGFEVQGQSETKTIEANGQTTFTLNYRRRAYSVTFNYNSGVVNSAHEKVENYLYEQILRDSQHPTKTDPANVKTYTFAGWEDEETNKIVDFSKNIKVTKNMRLRARWTEEITKRPIYLKMIWQGISGQDETKEITVEKERVVGQTAQISDSDISALISEVFKNFPHPFHETQVDFSKSMTSLTVTATQDKQYLTLYYNVKTYTVDFDYTGLKDSSISNQLKQTIVLKYTQKISQQLLNQMKSVEKESDENNDYVFEKLIDSETGLELDSNVAYNKNLKIKPVFKTVPATVSVTPRVADADKDKVNSPTWPEQLVQAGTKFVFQPKDNIKKGWKFLGWTTKPGLGVQEVVITRQTTEVYAVFAPAETTYTIKHIFEGIQGEIEEKTTTITKTAKTADSITVNQNDRLTHFDHGFILKTPAQTQIIEADGSTVFELRYARREFDVNFEVNYNDSQFSNATVSPNPATQKVKFEGRVKKPADPMVEKFGQTFDFKHWQDKTAMNGHYSEQPEFDFANFKVTKNLTLVAYFEQKNSIVNYTINHVLKGIAGNPDQVIQDNTKTAVAGSEVTISKNDRLTQYDTGFEVADQSQTKTILADGSATFTLVYTRRKYTITYEVNYNGNHFPGAVPSYVPNQTVDFEGKATRPLSNPTLTKPGYNFEFVQWQVKDEMNGRYEKIQAFDFTNTKITKNLTLVAYFEQKVTTAKYTINHVFEGLSGQADSTTTDNSKSGQIGSLVTVNRENRLTQYDHGFEVEQQNQTKPILADGSTVFTLRYKRRRFTVTYEVNYKGNHFQDANPSIQASETVQFEGKATVPSQLPTLTKPGFNYRFVHWQLKDYMYGSYQKISAFDFANTKITSNITLVAYFEEEKTTANYTIRHEIQGVDGQADEIIKDSTKSALVGSEVTVDNSSRLSGYEEGFDVAKQSQTKTIEADGSTTFVLKYIRKIYKVNFEVNYNNSHFSGVTQTAQPTQDIAFQGKVAKPDFAPALKKPGYTYTFVHWQDKAAMNNEYKEVTPFDFANTKITKATTLVAYFKEEVATANYTINHVLPGVEKIAERTVTEVKTGKVDSMVSVSEANGLQQYLTAGFDLPAQTETKKILANGQTTFTLTYVRRKFNVVYDYNSGELNGENKKTVEYQYEQTLADINHPVKKDQTGQKIYRFVGWINQETGSLVDFDYPVKVTKPLLLKAKWEEKVNTRPVYLKMIWENLDGTQDEVKEALVQKEKPVGKLLKSDDSDVQRTLSQFKANHPHPFHHDEAFSANSTTAIDVEDKSEKQYLTFYFKAKTYNVDFNRTGLADQSIADILKRTNTFKHSNKISAELIEAMKKVQKPTDDYNDYEFEKLIDESTGYELDVNTPYNKNIVVKPVFKTKPVLVSVTPKAADADVDKVNSQAWPVQKVYAGQPFNYLPLGTNIKKGWKFLGWTTLPGGPVQQITISRTMSEVYAVFAPTETTYTVRHILEGIENEIDEVVKETYGKAQTNDTVTISKSDRLTEFDSGFVVKTPSQSKVIQADGSTVFELRYERKTFEVNFTVNYNNRIKDASVSQNPETQKIKYQGKVKKPATNPTIEKPGRTFTFKHWQNELAMNGQYTEQPEFNFANHQVTQSLNLVAFFAEDISSAKYTIKHIIKGVDGSPDKEIIETKYAEINSQVTVNRNNRKDNYDHGFDVEQQNQTKKIEADGSTSFTLVYTRKTYRINFEVNYNNTHFSGATPSIEPDQIIGFEGRVKRPNNHPTLTNPGYTFKFIQWQLKDEMNGNYAKVSAFDFGNVQVNRNLTLVAYFESSITNAKYTIKHIINGIAGQTNNQEIVDNSRTAQIGSLVTINRENRLPGYDEGFIVEQQNQTQAIKSDGSTVFTLVYRRRTFTVSFEVNFKGNHFKDVNASSQSPQTVEYEGKAVRPAQYPTIQKQGFNYKFIHWQLKDDMNDTYRFVSEFNFNTKITKNITLVAFFEETVTTAGYIIQHIIEGVDNVKTKTIEDPKVTVNVGTKVTVNRDNRLVGYDEGFNIADQTQTKIIEANTTTYFILRYFRKQYKVNFEVNYNGNHFSDVAESLEPSQTIKYQGKVRRPEFAPTMIKEGYTYTFKHWQLKTDMNGEYKEISAFDFSSTTVNKDITLVAFFEEKQTTVNYTIKHILPGVDNIPERIELETKIGVVNSTVKVTEADRLARLEEGFELAPFSEEKKILANGQTSFVLNYTRKIFTVTYDYNAGEVNGSSYTTVQYKYQQIIKDVKHPTRVDPKDETIYKFTCWVNALDNSSISFDPDNNPTVITSDFTLKAQWQETKATRPVYVRLVWETLDNSPDEVKELPYPIDVTIGGKIDLKRFDSIISEYLRNNPHPNHINDYTKSQNTVFELIVTKEKDKKFLTAYYKANTYTVRFYTYNETDSSSISDYIKNGETVKYSQTVSKKFLDELAQIKPITTDQYFDYEFDHFLVSGTKFDPTVAYNKNIYLEAKYKKKKVTVEITPTVDDKDLDKVENPTWPTIQATAGNYFRFNTNTNVKKGWKIVGWTYAPKEKPGDFIITRNTTKVYAVFAPDYTTYTIEHIFEGIEGDISEEVRTVTRRAISNTYVTVDGKDGMWKYYHGFTMSDSLTQNIAPDGSTVFKLRYIRKVFEITWDRHFINYYYFSNQGLKINDMPTKLTLKYGAKIPKPLIDPKIVFHGRTYKFKHWQDSKEMNGAYIETTALDFSTFRIAGPVDLLPFFEVEIHKVNYQIVHYLEKQGESADLNDKYDEIIETKKDQLVELGAKYEAYPQLNNDLYFLDKTKSNQLTADLTPGDNTVKVYQYYSLKSITVYYKKETQDQYPEGVKVKMTRLVNLSRKLPDTDSATFVGWSNYPDNLDGPLTKFVAPIIKKDIYLYPVYLAKERDITYEIRKEKLDGEYEITKFKKDKAKIGSFYAAKYENPEPEKYEMTFSNPTITVHKDDQHNVVTIYLKLHVYKVTFNAEGAPQDLYQLYERSLKHGAAIGKIEISQVEYYGFDRLDFRIDGQKVKKHNLAYIETYLVTKNTEVSLKFGWYEEVKYQYPQTLVENPGSLEAEEVSERTLNFNADGFDLVAKFSRVFVKDAQGNRFEKYNGKYFKFEDVVWKKLANKESLMTEKIIDFSPYTISANRGWAGYEFKNSIFKAMLKDIAAVMGIAELTPPTWSHGDNALYNSLNPSKINKLVKEPTDYAKEILGPWTAATTQVYRGIDFAKLIPASLTQYLSSWHFEDNKYNDQSKRPYAYLTAEVYKNYNGIIQGIRGVYRSSSTYFSDTAYSMNFIGGVVPCRPYIYD